AHAGDRVRARPRGGRPRRRSAAAGVLPLPRGRRPVHAQVVRDRRARRHGIDRGGGDRRPRARRDREPGPPVLGQPVGADRRFRDLPPRAVAATGRSVREAAGMTRRRTIIAAVGFGLCLLVPVVVHQDYQLNVLFRIALGAALALAWNLVGGYAG